MSDAHHDEIAKLETLYAENPDGRIFTHLAEACRKAGELERARQVLADGLVKHPNYSSAHVVLGRVLMDLEQYDEARAEFTQVLELDRHNLVAIRSLGDIARKEGRTEDALEHYHQLLDLEPSDSDVQDLVEELSGDLVVPSGDTEEDEDDATAAVETEFEEAAAAMEPSGSTVAEESAVETDDGDDGEEEFDAAALMEAAARLDEDVAERGEGDDVMTETIAQVYARQGLYDRAIEVYEELIRARPDDEGLKERLAELEQEADSADAEEDVEDDVEEAPGEDWVAAAEWDAGADEEPDAVALEPEDPGAAMEAAEDAELVSGFESVEFDAGEADEGGGVESLAGLEVDDKDPETNLAVEPDSDASGAAIEGLETGEDPTEVASEDAGQEIPWSELAVEDGEDSGLSDGWDVDEEMDDADETDVESDPIGSDEPWDVVEGVADEAPADAEDSRAQEPVEVEPEESGEPPVADYLSGLLQWADDHAVAAQPAAAPGGADEAPVEAEPVEAEPVEAEPVEAPEASEPGATGETAGGAEDDDDLEMFRSWLESLKQ